ncbi:MULTISPECIES: DNA polymerase III subunit alpha [Chryseobacterium]|uniref:DNA polymerase III subunit alpha n=2 Tax=Chryseobacterium gleum TaxID=250 RepID=A0A448B0H3_CHRGE|nr:MULTISPECIES: DNA polymerase III subunit alpha [Chryseobacterium]AVK73261.1 DNA polymerase III subunit alpha [Chryseobacterium indologenes]AZB32269.1 DNA polymerase III subunit alpha [Chryseobacterium bernardetii]EFK33862.1 DNA polymerase III, alpha subunit [Chryseobacterium gleum ATCC 35910]MDG4650884.1 DNA polymerase III subunit alpha [Chryseobacterium arthrosphaerae]QQY34598.1 DNA polymerase III subunit alpha [Chryseobacterium gleum]
MFLNCHTYHSLRYGTISVEDLVQLAVDYKLKVLALTDINTVTGIYQFYRLCQDNGIKPVVGVDVRVENVQYYICLAKNPKGIAEVNRLLTDYNCDGISIPKMNPPLEHCFVIYSLQNIPEKLLEHEFIGVRENELNLLINSELKSLIHKMVILHPVTFKTDEEYKLHKVLRAIDGNTLFTKLTEKDYCRKDECFIDKKKLLSQFGHYPEIIENTKHIVNECSFDFEFNTPKNKKYFTDSRENDFKLLSQLAYEGLSKRYPDNSQLAKARVEKELKVIDELNFCGYFLITWDIIQYSNRMGFMHVGRGSGANSIIAYCLGITDICPLELDLYFERFLNLNRKSPPDFDIDWSWKNRDVILEYIFKKYGKDHVAFCGTNVEFKRKSRFRELGKVFGLPKDELDQLSKKPKEQHDQNSVVQLIYKYEQLLVGFPNQRSMHSCGILISEEPITNYSALEFPPKEFPIVQFDMHTAEDIGLEKFDILSQRGLGTIKDTVNLIKEKRGIHIDIEDTRISKDEIKCNEYLSVGKTIGCFYIESPAMRGLLRRLKCDNYKVLVAASSIIRPGVAQSGMMREYIFRHNHPGQFEYFHDVFEKELGETYGIMVYQEDVIKVAMHFGGVSAANGDVLRRAMSGKGRSLSALQKLKDDFFESCKRKGHPDQLSQEVYRQIESFAGYSFCKAHSASYAVESYQSLYLKVYYPIEFMVSAINNGGGFYRTEVYVHEAKMSGATIHNPCINLSEFHTTVYGSDVYLGLMHIEKLEASIKQFIPEERKENGDYKSLEDFVKRVNIGIETLQILIFVGAFRFTGKQKHELLIEARFLLSKNQYKTKIISLFDEPQKNYELPAIDRNPFEDAFDEIEILGFPVSYSIFDLLKTKHRGDVLVKDLLKYHKKQVRMLAYLISRKHVPIKMKNHPGKKDDMYFGTWIDVNGDYFDTAHFPDSLKKFPFKEGGIYLLLGTAEVDYHFPTVTITRMAKMPLIADPRYSMDENKSKEMERSLREDVSMTFRQPYPQEHEIGLPRIKMG